MNLATIIFIFMANVHANAQILSCESTKSFAGCFIASAQMTVNLHEGTFLLTRNYEPLCPQWPPFMQVSGKAISVNGNLQFYDKDGRQIGELFPRDATQGLYGKIMEYSFLGCRQEKLKTFCLN